MSNSNEQRASADPLRVAILGAGQMARQHARAIARLTDLARVVAVADPHGEAVEELRAIEAGDAVGDKFPRFKKSDDATALLLRIA